MSRICWWLVARIFRMLQPDEREAVQGDFAELGMSGGKALLELMGLVLRRQAEPWKDWQPWLCLFGLVGLVNVWLNRIALSLIFFSAYQTHFLHIYGTFVRNGLTATEEIMVLACQSIAVILSAWAAGFTMGSLSRRTVWINATLFYLVCLSLSPVRHVRAAMLGRVDFDIAFIVTLQAVLFLLPSILGLRQGVRQDKHPLRHPLWWSAAIITMTVLVTWMTGWRQIGWRAWSGGTWPHHLVSWESRLLPYALASWPVGYLIATALTQRRKRLSVAA
jgi:hypothetical protein